MRIMEQNKMKQGYYISAYTEISPVAHFLYEGNRHDHGIALWYYEDKKVNLVRYWELERLTGLKQHCLAFAGEEQFNNFLDLLLKQEGLQLSDIIEIWGFPGKCYNPFPEFTYHCMSHLFSSVLSDMQIFRDEKILACVSDGGSDILGDLQTGGVVHKKQYCMAYFDKKNNIREITEAYSPAILWNIASMYFGLKEGTLMALASACNSRLLYDIPPICVSKHVQLEIDKYEQLMDFFTKVLQLTKEDIGVYCTEFDDRFSDRENLISMAMKVVQKMSEDIMILNIDQVIQTHGIDPKDTYLSIAGGFALNCPCNTYLMKKYGFKGFLSVPCVSDSGMALGIGLFAFFNKLGSNFNFKLENAYYGEKCEIDIILQGEKYTDYIAEITKFNANQAVEDLIEAPFIWINDRAEIGPRALGNRSILGDPRYQVTKDTLNVIKQRQWWRPVAPIILYDEMDDWFEDCIDSPYMLQAIKIKSNLLAKVPAVAHMDGSARVQTLKQSSKDDLLLELMLCFYNKTGIPMIANTSLNDKGEPIINGIEEAMNFALRKKINIIYVNGYRILLKNHDFYQEKKPYKRKLEYLLSDYRHQETYRSFSREDIRIFFFFKKIFDEDYFEPENKQARLELAKYKFTLVNHKFVKMEYDFYKKYSRNIEHIIKESGI